MVSLKSFNRMVEINYFSGVYEENDEEIKR